MDPMIVYVVTFSDFRAERGEFFREEAFWSVDGARIAAFACMEEKGGRFQQGDSSQYDHVVECWDNHQAPGCTVWLERLRLR